MEEKDYTYTPTQWVDNSEPDIDAEHLNKIEAALADNGLALNDLVDAVANKLVAKAQLVNNGLTTEEGFALDARYGKTLADGLANLNGEMTATKIQSNGTTTEESINNFYDNFSSGLAAQTYYKTSVSHNVAHSILGGGLWFVTGFKNSSNFEIQTIQSYSANGTRFFTRCKSGGVWTAWVAK